MILFSSYEDTELSTDELHCQEANSQKRRPPFAGRLFGYPSLGPPLNSQPGLASQRTRRIEHPAKNAPHRTRDLRRDPRRDLRRSLQGIRQP